MAGLLRPEDTTKLLPLPKMLAAPGPVAPDQANPLPLPTPSPAAPPVTSAMPSWQPQFLDEGVASRVAAIAGSDSPLIRQARAAGQTATGRRGLLNSTMGAQAGEAEAYRVALPMAQQEASQAAARNMSSIDFMAQLERMRTQAGFDTAGRTQQGDISSRLQSEGSAQELTRLGAAAGFDMTRLNRTGELTLQQMQEESRLRSGEAATNFTYQQQLQLQSETARFRDMGFENDAQMQRLLAQGGMDIQRINAQADRSLEELQLQLTAGDRQAALGAAVSLYQAQEQMLAAIMSNTSIQAAERAQYQAAVEQRRALALNLIEQIYNVDLSWGQSANATAPAPPITPGGTPAVPAPGGTGGGGSGGLLTQPVPIPQDAQAPATQSTDLPLPTTGLRLRPEDIALLERGTARRV